MIACFVIKQYERAVVFRLGKVAGEARGPGLIFVAPFVNRVHRVSLRIVTMPIQSQGIITKDNVSIDVSAVAYYRVKDPVRSVVAIENVQAAISQIAQTTLRTVVGRLRPWSRSPARRGRAMSPPMPTAGSGPHLWCRGGGRHNRQSPRRTETAAPATQLGHSTRVRSKKPVGRSTSRVASVRGGGPRAPATRPSQLMRSEAGATPPTCASNKPSLGQATIRLGSGAGASKASVGRWNRGAAVVADD